MRDFFASFDNFLEGLQQQPTPLLGLVMIVKNEAHGILDTLESFRPYIDRWTILDTGSTDGTQDIIRRTLHDVPGQIVEEPFVDFATSRNRALDLHGTASTFTVMPDSDDKLEGGVSLRGFLLANAGATTDVAHEAYELNIRRGGTSYYLPLVLRAQTRWRYVGRVHEYVGRHGAPPATIKVPAVEVTQAPRAQSVEASKARWNRDLAILEDARREDPTDPRTLFYLAQTYDCLGRDEEALATYEERIRVGGWAEETFEASLRRARMMNKLSRPWPEVQQAYLDVHVKWPSRAEPIFEIASHYYYRHDNLALTYLFARRAMEMPMPDAVLFVDRDLYEWKAAHLVAIAAFYLDAGAKATGRLAAELATDRRGDDLIRANRVFYARSARELFGTVRSWKIPYEAEEPFHAANPSIHCDADGTWRCIIRNLNYVIVNGTSYEPPNGVIITHNVMAELDGDPAQGFTVRRIVKMEDRAATPRTDYPCHGFEDCRLFRAGDKLYFTATVCDFSTHVYGLREIVLGELDADYRIVGATPLRGSWSQHDQKNWMPFATQSDRVTIVYALDQKPRGAHGALGSSEAVTLKIQLGREYIVETMNQLPRHNTHLRGGSQLVEIGGGYLCLIHDVIFGFEYRRTYLSRFVWLDRDLTIRKMSELFYFERLGIEYACGLAVDPTGKYLVASYSVNDENANLGIFETEAVMKSLREDYVV